MSSDTVYYPGITHSGPIYGWQKTVYPESGSLMFAFNGAKVEYYEVRSALTNHYGNGTFDAMRQLQQTDDAHVMIVGAHFTRATDRSRELSKALSNNEQVTLLIPKSKNEYHRSTTKILKFKMFPSVPILGPFTVYRIDNLPLGASNEICAIVKKKVIDMLMDKLAKYERKDVIKYLIDIVPGYDEYEDIHLFDGTLSIVLKDFIGVYLQFDSIVMFGKLFKPTSNSAHYAYCKKCRILDSHLTDDCPRPISSSTHM